MKRHIQVEDSMEKPQKQQRLNASTGDGAVGLTEALDFTALNSLQEISVRFDELARSLMFSHVIHLHTPGFPPKDVEYEILELEFYLHKPDCHADPFTHRATEQRRSGQWYFHRTPTAKGVSATGYRGGSRKGMDLTFGSPVTSLPSSVLEADPDSTRGGILLRTIRRVKDQKVVSGPSRLVDEILAQSGAQSISELVQSKWTEDTFAFSPAVTGSRPSLRIIPRKGLSATANPFHCPRIGLDLSHRSTTNSPWDSRIAFVCKPYRYIIHPELLTFNGRPQTFIGVYDNLSESPEGDVPKLAKAIADVTGIKERTVLKYIESLNLGLEGKRALNSFIRTKTRSSLTLIPNKHGDLSFKPITDVWQSPLLSNRPLGLPPSTPATPKICLPNPCSETGVTTVCADAEDISYLAQFLGRCIRALATYTPRRQNVRYPRERCAAVLVALFVGRKGDLYVLLSRRASTLRTYAGDTALPGGKVDERDRNVEETARREALEEIGLATDRSKVPLLCVLEPFLVGNGVLITPVVVLVLDNTLRPVLNTPEVTQLFSHPLASFLSTESPFPRDQSTIEFPYHSYEDIPFHKGSQRKIRLHRFLTGREAGGVKPIFGVTAAIMIRVASIGYGLEPEFLLKSPSQPGMRERIERASNENKRAQARAKL